MMIIFIEDASFNTTPQACSFELILCVNKGCMYVCSDLQEGHLRLKSLRKIILILINMRMIKVLKKIVKVIKKEMYITKLKIGS